MGGKPEIVSRFLTFTEEKPTPTGSASERKTGVDRWEMGLSGCRGEQPFSSGMSRSVSQTEQRLEMGHSINFVLLQIVCLLAN